MRCAILIISSVVVYTAAKWKRYVYYNSVQ